MCRPPAEHPHGCNPSTPEPLQHLVAARCKGGCHCARQERARSSRRSAVRSWRGAGMKCYLCWPASGLAAMHATCAAACGRQQSRSAAPPRTALAADPLQLCSPHPTRGAAGMRSRQGALLQPARAGWWRTASLHAHSAGREGTAGTCSHHGEAPRRASNLDSTREALRAEENPPPTTHSRSAGSIAAALVHPLPAALVAR